MNRITILALTDNLFRCRELSENLFRRTKTEIGNSNRVSGKSLCIKYKQNLCFCVSFQLLLIHQLH